MLSTTPCRCLAAALLIAGTLLAADTKKGPNGDEPTTNYNIPLWEAGKVPMATGDGPLDAPFLTVFMPPQGKRNGSSVVIAPGGSNIMLMYGAEGIDIAERYNEWGAAAFVLTYRMSPKYNAAARALDGKRAIQMVRSRAAEWKLDPKKVGFAGFSAGSEITRTMASNGHGDPDAADPIDRFDATPNYLLLAYSVGRPAANESLKDFPPTFMVSAQGDRGPSMANAQFFMDLTKAGAVAEVHVFQKGRHGFGSGFGSPEFSDWMPRLRGFLKLDGFLPAEGK
jgi:acetyl esterase/lipase